MAEEYKWSWWDKIAAHMEEREEVQVPVVQQPQQSLLSQTLALDLDRLQLSCLAALLPAKGRSPARLCHLLC